MTIKSTTTGVIVTYDAGGYLARVGLPPRDPTAISLNPNNAHQFETMLDAQEAAKRHKREGYKWGTYSLRFWSRFCAAYKARQLFPSGESGRRGSFVTIGEFREPRKGEWYLSGAIPAAYLAPNDLSTPYHICQQVSPLDKVSPI